MIIKRDLLINQIIEYINSTKIRLIHIKGIAGSGKTTFIEDYVESYQYASFLMLDSSELENYSPETFSLYLGKSILSEKIFLKWRSVSKKRIENEILQINKYKKKNIKFNNKGTIKVKGDIIFGDVFKLSEKETKKLVYSRARVLLEELTKNVNKSKRIIIIVDTGEALNVNSDLFKWFKVTLLIKKQALNIKLIVVSREENRIEYDENKTGYLNVGALEENEANQLLINKGINNKDIRQYLCTITKCNALALTLAANLSIEIDIFNIPSFNALVALEEKLIVEFLLNKVLNSINDRLLKNAMEKLPILRIIMPQMIQKILNINETDSIIIIDTLLKKGYLKRLGMFFKYHDLLSELTIKYLTTRYGHKYFVEFNIEIANYYKEIEKDNQNRIICTIEPFHHFYIADPKIALEYFEPTCKTALDRKDKIIIINLLNEIDFNSLPNESTKGWYLLRFGGYFREYREYSKALDIFSEAISSAYNDKKLLAFIYNNIGWVYLFYKTDEKLKEAIELFNKSNKICSTLNLQNIVAMNYNNLGIANEKANNIKKAIYYYKLSLNITESKQYPDYLVSAKSHRNIALIYSKYEKNKCMAEYEISKELYFQAGDIQGFGETTLLQSGIMIQNKEYQSAKRNLDIALNCLNVMKDAYWISENYFALIRVLFHLNSFNDMYDCILNMCKISILENWRYHQIVIQRLVQYLRYIQSLKGINFTRNTIDNLFLKWGSDNDLKHLKFITFFNEHYKYSFTNSEFWTTKYGNKIHKINSICSPSNWENVFLLDKVKKSNLCKKCIH